MTRAIMIQGAGSNVGKSLLVAGIARALSNRGLRVAPFKPQNMSNNAAVTADGGEIGRAQALQAMAARRPALRDMNPVLLKPESETSVQVIVQGRRLPALEARDFTRAKPRLLAAVLESFHRLAQDADIVLVEGAGSPAEINLRAGDITLFDAGRAAIEERTGWPSLGVLPWFDDAWRLPAEDVLDIRSANRPGALKIAVPQLPRIANFDDLDPLSAEPGVSLEMIGPGRPLPGDAALVLLPGSKATMADLAFFRAQGWDIDLAAHLRRGGHALGICGGFQMLGQTIADPAGIEGAPGRMPGLGLLDVETVMTPEKRLALQQARYLPTGVALEGYEIHIGQTTGPDCARPWLCVRGEDHGAMSADGRIMGCYLHGLFASDRFRADFLARLGGRSALAYGAETEAAIDRLGAHIAAHLDLDLLMKLSAPVPA